MQLNATTCGLQKARGIVLKCKVDFKQYLFLHNFKRNASLLLFSIFFYFKFNSYCLSYRDLIFYFYEFNLTSVCDFERGSLYF